MTLQEWLQKLYQGNNCKITFIRKQLIEQCQKKMIISKFMTPQNLIDPSLYRIVREIVRYLCLTPQSKLKIITPHDDNNEKVAPEKQQVYPSAPPAEENNEANQQQQEYYKPKYSQYQQQYQQQQQQQYPPVVVDQETPRSFEGEVPSAPSPVANNEDEDGFEMIHEQDISDMFSFNAIKAADYGRFSILIGLLKQSNNPIFKELFSQQEAKSIAPPVKSFETIQGNNDNLVNCNNNHQVHSPSDGISPADVGDMLQLLAVPMQLALVFLEIAAAFAK